MKIKDSIYFIHQLCRKKHIHKLNNLNLNYKNYLLRNRMLTTGFLRLRRKTF